MTNEIIKRMTEEINAEIRMCKKEYDFNGRSAWYYACYNRTCGMIKMLSIATGKKYFFDEDGLQEA